MIGSPGDASRFRQDTRRVARVGEHEEEKRRRERSLLERKDAVDDQDGRPSHDVHVAHVGGDHLESQLPLQPGREVSGPRAEIQHGALGRQPFTHLLHQLSGAPFHDGVEESTSTSLASSNPATVLGSYPASRSSRVSRRTFGQKPRSRSLG